MRIGYAHDVCAANSVVRVTALLLGAALQFVTPSHPGETMNRWLRTGLGVWALLLSCAATSVEPFFAAPLPTGSIAVDLHATEVVTANTPVVASFGVPFPRGSITTAQLSTLRVLDNGAEMPAYVQSLTPWRHRSDAGIDGQSVRVALVQVEVAFANPGLPKRIVVEWGGPARTLNRPTRALRATTWHPVASGSFVAADNVLEPDVYASLPAAWLSRGALRTSQALPFAANHPATRDDPATNDAIATWPGFTEADHALKNGLYTVVNEDDPLVTAGNQCPYKTAFEPWLYDRAATMFTLHFRSGFLKPLREAVRHAEFYRARVNGSGFFSLNAGDNKYSFNESLAYAYWMTGDDTFLPAITNTANAHNGSPHAWTAALGFWTERMVAFKLMAHAIDYEITGNATRRDSVNAIVTALAAHQNGALAGIPANRIDGGWYHTGDQHGDWDGAAYGASTWMTALLSDALRRAYVTDEHPAIADMIRRSGLFLRTALRTEAGDYGIVLAPRYVIEHDGTDFAIEAPIHDAEHALDVVAAIAWADYFGALTGPRDPLLAPTVDALYDTYDLGVNFWIRPAGPASGLPAFRVNPWRKWGWEHRTSDGLAWAVQAAAAESPLFANGFE